MPRFLKILHSWMYAFAVITGITLIASCHKNNFQDKELQLPLNTRAAFLNSTSIGSLQVITVPNVFINNMAAVVSDAVGNIYTADSTGNLIWKIRPGSTPTIFAGSAGTPSFTDGQGAAARFNKPIGLAIDAAGNLYVADKNNHAVRKITPDSVVTTLAGNGSSGTTEGPGLNNAQFNFPSGVAVDAAGNVYVADAGNNKIRKIKPDAQHSVSTFAGNGTQGHNDDVNGLASFFNPTGVAVDASNNVYVADAGNNKIRIIAGGETNTLAGGGVTGETAGFSEGTGSAALFNKPMSVTVDAAQNVYVADKNNNRIRQISSSKVVSTLAGTGAADFLDGVPTLAKFNGPTSVFVNSSGYVIVADAGNIKVREIGFVTQVSTIAGNGIPDMVDGTGIGASFYFPIGITTDAAGNLFVADYYNHVIRKITPAGVVTKIAGVANGFFAGGFADGPAATARFNFPSGIAVDASGNLYVADSYNNRIRKITSAGVVSTFAGNGNTGFADGPATSAMFDQPRAVIIDGNNNLYVADFYNHRIRKITPAGMVTTLAGIGIGSTTGGFADGPGNVAQFNNPKNLAADAAGNIYVADYNNQRIRKITPDGTVSTLAGTGAIGFLDGPANTAMFNMPTGIAADAAGNVYVADAQNKRVRKISPAGVVTSIAGIPVGTGVFNGGYLDGPGNFAQFGWPMGLVVGTTGALYMADPGNHRIRKIQ